MLICAGDNETFNFAHPIGVGLIKSAINLTKLCLFDKPDFLLFIGSAGSYTKKYNIFDIVQSSSGTNLELSFLQNQSYSPIDNAISIKTNIVQNKTTINSSNYITTDENIANRFEKHNIELENMEFYSVLEVAKEFNIGVGGIFVVTNYCNNDAHGDFIANHTKAKELLTKYLVDKKIIKPV